MPKEPMSITCPRKNRQKVLAKKGLRNQVVGEKKGL